MADYESAVFTNMCMVCDGNRILVQDRVSSNWPGITFPGGKVEMGESFVESARREVYEETGLTVKSLKLCGTKQFQDKNDARYVVLFYRTDEFEGQLTSSDEGEVFWIDKSELLDYELAQDFKEMFEVFDSELLSEFYYYEEEGEFRLRLL
ncbi:8-oxo-dGTP diphosphatase [Salinicoccus carnicancri]|uniref:8-oxo-dGTP diphosphatase n=1 Tax=Salinicoccus carnicancri TaxID=558170 RepID=UPI0003138AAA|nr:8-oxo-dGTP diphosphatase [Salinicoccus carnicancri]